jgi:hypothetical protein
VTSNNARRVVSYLASYESSFIDGIPKKRVTGRFRRGRGDGPFFLPGMASDIEFAPSGTGDMSLFRAFASRRGTIQGWREAINLVGDDTMMIPQAAVCAAFVPPLQGKLQIPILSSTSMARPVVASPSPLNWPPPSGVSRRSRTRSSCSGR